MKNKITILFAFALLAVLVFTPAAYAQTALPRTALSAALASATQTTIPVVSTTGISVSSNTNGQWWLFIDGEQMGPITAVDSTNNLVTVTSRGTSGTFATGHLIRSTVWAGPSAAYVATDLFGRCTRAQGAAFPVYLPVINPKTGNVFDCIVQPSAASGVTTQGTTSNWTGVNFQAISLTRPYKKLRPETTTYTLLPADEIVGIPTNVAVTITIPALTGAIGKIYQLQLEVAGSNSVTVQTSSAQTINGGSSIIFGGTSWANNPALGNFQGLRFYTDGFGNWFANMIGLRQ